ncbi:hypothetical protein SAMN02745229_01626 [Butyrivibrio fibrisolvens DSM 3071]|uniref:Uncharacterized protein n=1 Tax=Butyrivibrio fibrisolvens DSM 3071 TaxID=1121131 RepID=A0A1M5YNV9_BUTFI|nr:hypothetical protein [Butyrivibrio fibrisolvens]SHI13559.1 hypothetical protein SAMN02745229_01626 [Butyrivibrio fibrisolvens DSM 3071]
MDKNQVIEILNSKGYSAHDTNGILYIDLEDIGASSINKMRTLLSQLHYYNSWGIKKIQAGVLAATNRTLDLTDEFDYSADHEKESAGHENDLINLEKETSSNSEDDDMMFDENSPFEQVSLFDMMN